MGNIGAQDYNNAFSAANAARGYGQDASQNYGTTYQLEAPNAGWGKKMLGGALGAAAPLLSAIPGVGPFLGPMASAFGGQMSGQPQQGGGYSNMFAPAANAVSGWFNPSMASAQSNMPSQYQSTFGRNSWMWNPWGEPQAA